VTLLFPILKDLFFPSNDVFVSSNKLLWKDANPLICTFLYLSCFLLVFLRKSFSVWKSSMSSFSAFSSHSVVGPTPHSFDVSVPHSTSFPRLPTKADHVDSDEKEWNLLNKIAPHYAELYRKSKEGQHWNIVVSRGRGSELLLFDECFCWNSWNTEADFSVDADVQELVNFKEDLERAQSVGLNVRHSLQMICEHGIRTGLFERRFHCVPPRKSQSRASSCSLQWTNGKLSLLQIVSRSRTWVREGKNSFDNTGNVLTRHFRYVKIFTIV